VPHVQELLLHRMQVIALRDALDGGDRCAFGFHAQHQAGAHDPAVADDGAGAAVAGRTAFLAAGEAEHVAQRVQHGLLRLAQELDRLAIDGCRYVMLAHQ
jgi:hypothetical protein